MPSIKDLLMELGYKDPVPNAGKWNKRAMKLRALEVRKFDLKPYKFGSYRDYESDGGYVIRPIYKYNGKIYQ